MQLAWYLYREVGFDKQVLDVAAGKGGGGGLSSTVLGMYKDVGEGELA